MTPNFRRISAHFLEKDCCTTAGQRNRATLTLLSQLSGRSSLKPSTKMTMTPAPTAETLSYLAPLRTEPVEEELPSPDEGAAPKLSGWRGSGSPLIIGTGYTERERCRCATACLSRRLDHRKYPSSPHHSSSSSPSPPRASSLPRPSLRLLLVTSPPNTHVRVSLENIHHRSKFFVSDESGMLTVLFLASARVSFPCGIGGGVSLFCGAGACNNHLCGHSVTQSFSQLFCNSIIHSRASCCRQL